jgi:hypothetical protein
MNTTHHAVLFSLFDMAKRDRHATVIRIVQATELTRLEVERALLALDQAGLVDASRVRLTMPGLTYAAMLGAPVAARRTRLAIAKKAA